MVRGGLGLREQRGGREGGGVVEVDEGSVKFSKDRLFLTIGPSEPAAKKGNFHQPKEANGVIESVNQVGVDVISVFLVSVADEIEISYDDPRASNCRCKLNEFLEEGVRVAVIGRAIDVSNLNRKIRYGALE
jgi:hypothetical protein